LPSISCFALTFAIVAQAFSAGRPYQPRFGDPIEEPWRWSKIEAFSEFDVTCVSESTNGHLWFGTGEGVIVYDGYEVTESLECGRVRDIKVFGADEVYAASVDGLWRFNGVIWTRLAEHEDRRWSTGSIVRSEDGTVWVLVQNNLHRVVGDRLEEELELGFYAQGMSIDEKNRLWIAMGGRGGVRVYPLRDGRIESLSAGVNVLPGVPAESLLKYQLLKPSGKGGMWVVASGREPVLRRVDEEFKEHLVDDPSDFSIERPILDMVETPAGAIWLSNRIDLLLLQSGGWREFSWRNLLGGTPKVMEMTSDGRIILGGGTLPLFVVDVSDRRWSTLLGLMFQCEDREGNRWYLGENGEVVVEDPLALEWREFDHRDGVIDTPVVVMASADGTVWASGGDKGKAAVSYYRNGEWIFGSYPDVGNRFSHLSAYEGRGGDVYFGCGDEFIEGAEDAESAGGVVVYRKGLDGYAIERMRMGKTSPRVVSIVGRDKNEFWFGGMGLFRSAAGEAELVSLPNTVERRWIDHVVAGSNGDIWTAVFGRGVYRIRQDEIERFTKHDGLRSDNASHLLLDAGGRLWVGSPEGISRFDGEAWSSMVLPEELRIGREAGTMRQSRDGGIWINRSERAWFFREPGRLLRPSPGGSAMRTVRYFEDERGPETYLGKFAKEIHGVENVHLSWNGIDFLSKTRVGNLEFSYRFDGGAWSQFAKETHRMFLNVEMGEHVFEVRARDQDGNIDESPSVATFKMIPLLWKRPWFIATEVAVFVLVVGLIIVIVRMRMRYMVESREFKIWFFTEISHELKTPLSLILGPIESVLKDLPNDKMRDSLGIARRNARRMLRLVGQLLEFQKVEMGDIKMELARLDLVAFIKDTCTNHELLAKEKDLDLVFESDRESCITSMDAEKLQKIVDNLLSNAIKYTPEFGKISCRLEIEERAETPCRATIQVEDSGIGIPKKDLPLIFKRYHRVRRQRERGISGSGVGLALTYELVQVCHGSIEVESPIKVRSEGRQGARFTVSLPLFSPAQGGDRAERNIDLDREPSGEPKNEKVDVGYDRKGKPLLLLVDDNSDVRKFLSGELEGEFMIAEARNGREGLQVARDLSPDLIISDVMMPEMDGNEFCRQLKSDQLTSHIPVIMLTAKSSVQSELHGLELGADDYLSKPVDTMLLAARIRNQLISREELRARFVRETVLNPKEVTVTSVDEEFLKHAISIVEQRILDTELSVETLAEGMYLSRTTLFRKFKAICGQTPTAFISSIRLKRAKQIMRSGSFTVAEVGHQVGFSDSSYFSHRFKKEFGVTPTEYMAKNGSSKVRS